MPVVHNVNVLPPLRSTYKALLLAALTGGLYLLIPKNLQQRSAISDNKIIPTYFGLT
jgi:hypothetical protein